MADVQDLVGRLDEAVRSLDSRLGSGSDDERPLDENELEVLQQALGLLELAARPAPAGEPPERRDPPAGSRPAGRAPGQDRERCDGLRGHSSAVTIPELLSFVSASYKSGLLRVRTLTESFLLQIENGSIVDARSDRFPVRQGLVEILAQRGSIAAGDVKRLQLGGARSLDSLVATLLQEELVSIEELQEALGHQARSLFQRLCSTGDADFWFHEGARITTRPRIRLNVTQLLLESAQAADERARGHDAPREAQLGAATSDDAALDQRMSAALEQLLASDEFDLPLLDHSAGELLGLCWDEHADAAALEERISLDMGLCANLLRIANSAIFAPAVPITSVRLALVRLGLDNIRDLVLGLTIQRRVFQVPGWEAWARAIWRRAAIRSGFARSICRVTRSGIVRGGMLGLLLEVGKPVVLAALFRLRSELGRELDPGTVEGLLEDFHPRVGAALIRRWSLPDWLENVVRHQRDPESVQEHRVEAWVAQLADRFARWAEAPDEAQVDELATLPAGSQLGLSSDAVRAILAEAGRIREMAAIYA